MNYNLEKCIYKRILLQFYDHFFYHFYRNEQNLVTHLKNIDAMILC